MKKILGGMLGAAGLVLTANGVHTHVFLPPSTRPELDIRPVDVWSLVPTRAASRCVAFEPLSRIATPIFYATTHAHCRSIARSVLSYVRTNVFRRLFGAVADIQISSPAIREAVYGAWCNVFDVVQSDMDRPLKSFTSLGEFFQRPLKPGVRPIDTSCALASPADCKVLTVGCTQDDVALQVKGLPYSLSALLGTASAPSPGCSTHYCVLYLAPGDYHRFHSPAHVKLLKSAHFAGELLPVNPRVAYKVPSLFVRNERACILGTWALKGMESEGLDSSAVAGLKFGMAAVGAYNVGGITLNCNPTLHSNASEDDSRFDGGSARSVVILKQPLALSPGDMVGSFRIGSTLVLAVEVPDHWNFSFTCKSGEKLQVGQALGRIDPTFAATAAAK